MYQYIIIRCLNNFFAAVANTMKYQPIPHVLRHEFAVENKRYSGAYKAQN